MAPTERRAFRVQPIQSKPGRKQAGESKEKRCAVTPICILASSKSASDRLRKKALQRSTKSISKPTALQSQDSSAVQQCSIKRARAIRFAAQPLAKQRWAVLSSGRMAGWLLASPQRHPSLSLLCPHPTLSIHLSSIHPSAPAIYLFPILNYGYHTTGKD